MARSIPHSQKEALKALLRGLRKDRGWSQAELAKKLRQPQSYVSRYELGERRLDILELRQLCKAFDLSLRDFVDLLEAKIK